MRTTQYFLATLKEIPTDTETVSNQIMLRAGMIRKLASGLYSWLPTGLRVLRKLENIIREEMNNIGAMEILMPIAQPTDIWKQSGRLEQYGAELLQFTDRNSRSFILGPTHEEIVTILMCNEIKSYKQLPLSFYQIQTKFRDEIRPRSGVLRSREFIMKDAYSFHTNIVSLQNTYDLMYYAYNTILSRIQLKFRVIQANTGIIGGNISHEFYVITKSGTNILPLPSTLQNSSSMTSTDITYATLKTISYEKLRLVDTPYVSTIIDLITQFSLSIKKTTKTLLVHANKNLKHCTLVALMIRGDHQLDIIKAEKLPQVLIPLKLASETEIFAEIGTYSHYIGPINLSLPLIIDYNVSKMYNFVAGANINKKYFFGINWKRDIPLPQIADLCDTIEIPYNLRKNECMNIEHGIEVGHIFQLGTKYSNMLQAVFKNQQGNDKMLIMGCYGIGITRLVAAVIEQYYEKYSVILPSILAPFNIVIIPINMYKSSLVYQTAQDLYIQLKKRNIDVILDDRKENPGVMFSDMELIGIPHQLIISDRKIHAQEIEYLNKCNNEKKIIKLHSIMDFIETIFAK